MGGAMKCFLKILLGHEIFRSMVSWAMKEFVKPSGPYFYILNARSLNVGIKNMSDFRDVCAIKTMRNVI